MVGGALLALLCVKFGSRRPTTGPLKRIRAAAKVEADAYRERRRLRIAELSADPAKRKYAELMERGGYWSDSQIAYEENREITATCRHLAGIEHDMRLAGIKTLLFTEGWQKSFAPMPHIQADCRINGEELIRRYTLADSVNYREGYQPERHESDNPWAQLTCKACQSRIDLVHPEWPRAGTPWFPAPPGQT